MQDKENVAINAEIKLQGTKLNKTPTKYYAVAMVKNTGQENGPGHVSVALVEKKSTTTKSEVAHSSFYPGPLGSIINGCSLGSVPVLGQMATDHSADLAEADSVWVRELSPEAYTKGRRAQTLYHSDVENGRRLYSVFGRANPLASGASRLLSAYQSAVKTNEQHKKSNGDYSYPPEDHCGIPVFANEVHATPEIIKPDNCASSVTHILKATGMNLKNPQVPSFFSEELDKNGFKSVSKETLKDEFKLYI